MQPHQSYGSTGSSFVKQKRPAGLGRNSIVTILCALAMTVLVVSLNGGHPGNDASVELMHFQYGKLSAVESRRDEEAIDNLLKGKIGSSANGVPSSVIAAAQDAARAVKEQQLRVKHQADANLRKQAAIVNKNAENLFEQAVKDQSAEDAQDAAQMQIAMQSEHARGLSRSEVQ
jgi:hypothetical protein